MSIQSIEEAQIIARDHLDSIDSPGPGFGWSVEVDQELSDGWLFSYSFHSIDSSNREEPLIAGALGFHISKVDGQCLDLAAGQWFEAKKQGRLPF